MTDNQEFCINRIDDAHSRRSQTREESVTCGSELEKPLFIKKYQGRFFQTDVETSSDRASSDNEAPPVPPPRSKSKESSVALQSPTQIELLYFCFCPPGKSLCRRNLQLVSLCIFIFILILILKTLPEAQQTQGSPP